MARASGLFSDLAGNLFPNLPWRRPRVERSPVLLTARRLYILPTRHGLVFGALLVALLWGSMNYTLSLGFLFTFLLGSVGVVAMLHTQRNLHGLILQAEPVKPVFAGEAARFRLRIDPRGRARFGLVLSRGTERGLADIETDADAIELALPQARRGLHAPGKLELASTYPLGLFRCWTRFDLDWSVLVYPAPAAPGVPLPSTGGNGESGQSGKGDDLFDGLRPYQPGDSPKRIAWKQAARGLGLQTKQFSGERGGQLWLDWELAPEATPEARLSRLTRWALEAEAHDLPWGMRLPGSQLSPGRGDTHLHRALEILARHGQR